MRGGFPRGRFLCDFAGDLPEAKVMVLYARLPWYFKQGLSHGLTYVSYDIKLTYMEKTRVYLRKEELEGLRHAAARSGRSVADLIREAIRKVILRPPSTGPVALWDGEPKRTSIEHDSVHDDP